MDSRHETLNQVLNFNLFLHALLSFGNATQISKRSSCAYTISLNHVDLEEGGYISLNSESFTPFCQKISPKSLIQCYSPTGLTFHRNAVENPVSSTLSCRSSIIIMITITIIIIVIKILIIIIILIKK